MNILQLETVDSTNNYAKARIKTLADKTIVHALRQTNGRGRLERSWIDLGEGNLFISIILKPSNTFRQEFSNLTQYLSVVLCKVLENKYNLKPQIKWPNDVLADGKKIAGILCETSMDGNILNGIILGLGVNLNTKEESLKSVTDKIATGLNIETGKNIDTNEFLNNLLNEFFKNYDNFINQGFELIKTDYINRNCSLNKDINIQVFNEIKSGFAKEINNNGELILLSKDDKVSVLTIGDIL